MVKHLTKTGNSLALVLDRPLLEATRIDAGTPLEVSTDGDVIVITPVRGQERREKFESGIDKVTEQYSGVFRRLSVPHQPQPSLPRRRQANRSGGGPGLSLDERCGDRSG